jgi:hypothetical protein
MLLSDEERERSELGADQCVMESTEGTHYFIRACLDIPIIGADQPYTWGVWCSLSETNFWEASDHWSDPGRIRLGPYFGWLSAKIPFYPDTMFLKTLVRHQEVGLRPLVELEPTDHLLSVHQRQGIRLETIQRIVSCLLHDRDDNPFLPPPPQPFS